MITSFENYADYPKLSQSELYSLNRCKKMFEYSYVQGLVSVDTPDYLSKGSFYHNVIAEYLRRHPDVTPDDIPAIAREIQVADLKANNPTVDEPVRILAAQQLSEYFREISSEDFTVVAVEEEIYADVGWKTRDGTPVLFHGFIDGVVRDSEGNPWVVEHKTAARAWSQSQFEFAYQGKLYAHAWEVLTGERPMGIQYNFFYPKRFDTRQQYVSKEESRLILDEIQQSIILRDYITESGVYPREPKWGCNDCRFRDLCFAELVGGDAAYVRKDKYIVDTDRQRYEQEVNSD